MQLITTNSIILNIFFTSNNILCTITTLKGNVIRSFSIGRYKIKGLKKITTTTLNFLVKDLCNSIKKKKTIYIRIKGVNKNKNDFIKALKTIGFNILLIQEKLSLSHGGCRKSRLRKI